MPNSFEVLGKQSGNIYFQICLASSKGNSKFFGSVEVTSDVFSHPGDSQTNAIVCMFLPQARTYLVSSPKQAGNSSSSASPRHIDMGFQAKFSPRLPSSASDKCSEKSDAFGMARWAKIACTCSRHSLKWKSTAGTSQAVYKKLLTHMLGALKKY